MLRPHRSWLIILLAVLLLLVAANAVLGGNIMSSIGPAQPIPFLLPGPSSPA